MKGPDGVIMFHGIALTRRIKEVARNPEELKAVISGTVASIVAAFDDEEWERIMDASKMPCGLPDCDCEVFGEQEFIGLNAAREHHKRVVAKWEKR